MTESPPTEQKQERLYAVGAGMCIASGLITIGYFVETIATGQIGLTPTILSIAITTGMSIALSYEANHGAFGVSQNAD